MYIYIASYGYSLYYSDWWLVIPATNILSLPLKVKHTRVSRGGAHRNSTTKCFLCAESYYSSAVFKKSFYSSSWSCLSSCRICHLQTAGQPCR